MIRSTKEKTAHAVFSLQSGRRDSNSESPAPKADMLAVTPRPVVIV